MSLWFMVYGSVIMDIRTRPLSGNSTLKSADTFRLSRSAINDTDSKTVQYAQHLLHKLFCVCVFVSVFRSMILELIFITYLDPNVTFQADLWRCHAPVWGLTTSVCDRHSISIWTQNENGL
jgi:hypothetical protein